MDKNKNDICTLTMSGGKSGNKNLINTCTRKGKLNVLYILKPYHLRDMEKLDLLKIQKKYCSIDRSKQYLVVHIL